MPELQRGPGSFVPYAAGAAGEGSTPVELLRALAVLAEPPRPAHRTLARVLELPSVPGPADYADLFLFQLYPYASVHLGPEGMMGGAARDRIAGFWSALGRTPPVEPDHLSALLGLYASLAEESARGPTAPERALASAGRAALLHEHLTPWVFAFLDRVRDLTRGPYATWAGLLADVLLGEFRREGVPPGLSAHLRDAEPLPDPREEGAGLFLSGLLAPARSGLILVRADLARIAAEHGLGLRAGERRYALEHLLGQQPARVLESLSRDAERAAESHTARAGSLGETAAFLAERTLATAGLLRALAAEGAPLCDGEGSISHGTGGRPVP